MIDLKAELKQIMRDMIKENNPLIKDYLFIKGKEIIYLLNAQEIIINEIKKIYLNRGDKK